MPYGLDWLCGGKAHCLAIAPMATLQVQTRLLLDSLLNFNSIDTSITSQTGRSSWILEEANLELPQLAGQQAMFTLEAVPFINDYG